MNAPEQQTIGRGWRRYGRAVGLALGLLAFGLVLRAVPVSADTWTPTAKTCTSGNGPATYTVPGGIRYVGVEAIGGAGFGGASYNGNNTGGPGGTGAKITAYLPVTPFQQLKVGVGRNGAQNDGYSGRPNGAQSKVGAGQGGGSSVVTTAEGNPCLGCELTQDADYTDFNICYSSSHELERAKADTTTTRAQILVIAGGGGGGGGGNTFGSGGAGGNAGVNADLSGQSGSHAYHLSSDCDYGNGGAGGSVTAAGGAGSGGCFSYNGSAGSGFFGGMSSNSGTNPGLGGGGNGGGGYYGGGGGGSGGTLGGGGGGAGSSYVTPAARGSSNGQDTSARPSVTITPISTPTTTATLSGTTSGNNWYTSAVTITLTARAGTLALGRTYYALNNPACSATNVAACTMYTAPLTISTGVHTLTYFSVDAVGLDEAVQTKSFAVTVTSTPVSGASIGSGPNPTATTTGGGGSVSVSGAGSGVVGAAVYGSNPQGAATFNSSGAYVDVIVAGSGLTSLTITNCSLNGGTNVYWWTGAAWALASHQTYNATTRCVTITVTSTTSPSLSQLTGTVIAAGRPPTITATATTADGKPYTAGAWTNQSVTVAFTCSTNATPTAPVTRASDGANQSASGTCTDGVGQKAETTFTGINVDKTPPTCAATVSPTVLWPPNGKLVAITGTATVGDTLSGVARVVGSAVTSNEVLAAGDVQGFTINTTYSAPLRLSADVAITGQLNATRTGSGSGRAYTQTLTVTDQAGNVGATPCSWTVTVPHDQGGRR